MQAPRAPRTPAGRSTPPAPGDDVEDLVTAVLTASRVLVGVSVRSVAAIEETITLTQFRTLVVLAGHGQVNLNGLAEALGVNASTAMRTVDRLLAADLVSRRDNPANRRQVLLDLTPAGRRVVRAVTRRRRAAIAKIVATMPTTQHTDLVAALRSFAEAAGEPEPDPDLTGW